MAKNKTETQSEVESPKPNLTHTALGTFHNPGTNQWYVAVLKYDPVTGNAKMETSVLAGEDRYFAAEAFKLEALNREVI